MSLASTLSKYPKLGRINPRPKNHCARCKCGAVGKFKVDIQFDWMRGNDEVYWACDQHKKDVAFLTDNAKWVRQE